MFGKQNLSSKYFNTDKLMVPLVWIFAIMDINAFWHLISNPDEKKPMNQRIRL